MNHRNQHKVRANILWIVAISLLLVFVWNISSPQLFQEENQMELVDLDVEDENETKKTLFFDFFISSETLLLEVNRSIPVCIRFVRLNKQFLTELNSPPPEQV